MIEKKMESFSQAVRLNKLINQVSVVLKWQQLNILRREMTNEFMCYGVQ